MEIVHHHFESLSSTNDWAKAHFLTFDEDKLTLISAEEQTAGRGQYDRKWLSLPHINIYCSFCFFSLDNHEPYQLTRLLAFSIKHTLKTIPCEIKWPNDVMVRGKKLAGILCETIPLKNRQAIILGLGLNVNLSSEESTLIDQPSTSLLQELGVQQDKNLVLAALTADFILEIERFHIRRNF